MAFYYNTTKFADEKGINVPSFSSTTRPSNPVNGVIIYNTTFGIMEVYVDGFWKPADNEVPLNPFLYRQIITTGYVMGGYKDTSPWKNVNRMNHSTDVMTNLGDLLAYAGAYTSGAVNLTKGFIWSTDNTWPGSSTTTSAFNLATETTAGTNSNWNMTVGRGMMATIFKEWYYAWVFGGGNGSIDQFNLTTEVMSSTGQSSLARNDGGTGGVASISDELKAFAWGEAVHKYAFATGTGSTLTVNTSGTVAGAHDQQKGINSKHNRGYCGNEGSYNAGYNLRRWNLITETNLGTVGKPVGNSGEENFDMGQHWQYMMGMYDGAQNNRGWKFTYATDSGYELGSGSVRTGVSGGSSGHCVWKG